MLGGGAMHESTQSLLEEQPIVTDGAWGTQLQARGLAAGEVPRDTPLENLRAMLRSAL